MICELNHCRVRLLFVHNLHWEIIRKTFISVLRIKGIHQAVPRIVYALVSNRILLLVLDLAHRLIPSFSRSVLVRSRFWLFTWRPLWEISAFGTLLRYHYVHLQSCTPGLNIASDISNSVLWPKQRPYSYFVSQHYILIKNLMQDIVDDLHLKISVYWMEKTASDPVR